MMPSTSADTTTQPPCADAYRALYEACRSDELARRSADHQVSQLARLVSDFALCARAAKLRSDVVLAELRSALEPIVREGQVHVPTLIERAIRDYYQSHWQ